VPVAAPEQPAANLSRPAKYRATFRHIIWRRVQIDYDADSRAEAVTISKAIRPDDLPVGDECFELFTATSVRPVRDNGRRPPIGKTAVYWPELLPWFLLLVLSGVWVFARLTTH